MTTTWYPCGCLNETDERCGVMRSVSKCAAHTAQRQEVATLGVDYYRSLGVLAGGVPHCQGHIAELVEAIGEPPAVTGGRHGGPLAVEVGCGLSMYAPLLLSLGYRYLGIEPSFYAASWTRATFDVEVIEATFDAWQPGIRPQLLLAAHVVEHLPDAPAALARMGRLLQPGGRLYVIVPDDSDPVNPDHLWFFSPESLRECVRQAGLELERLAIRQRIAREKFLYLSARKP